MAGQRSPYLDRRAGGSSDQCTLPLIRTCPRLAASHAQAQVFGEAPGSRTVRRGGRPGQGIIEANRKVSQGTLNALYAGWNQGIPKCSPHLSGSAYPVHACRKCIARALCIVAISMRALNFRPRFVCHA